jgi:hypothetical protein
MSKAREVEVVLRVLDDIESDRIIFPQLYAHRPEHLEKELRRLEEKFEYWHGYLTGLLKT